MASLTTEQYREDAVCLNGENVPNVRQLTKQAVREFYRIFRKYPDVGGVGPGAVNLLGDHMEVVNGLAVSTAAPIVTVVVGKIKSSSRDYTVHTTADVGKPHKVTVCLDKNKLTSSVEPEWITLVKTILRNYPFPFIPGFEAVVHSSIPLGAGFGSKAALQVAFFTFLEVLVGTKLEAKEKAKKCEVNNAICADGMLERLTSIQGLDDQVLIINCQTYDSELISFDNSNYVLVAVDIHGSRHHDKDKERKEMCEYVEKATSLLGLRSLNEAREDDIILLQERVLDLITNGHFYGEDQDEPIDEDSWTPERLQKMMKTAKFFIKEMYRVSEGVEALINRNMEKFGQLLTESHASLIEDLDFQNDDLDNLVQTSLGIGGVLGSRVTGQGACVLTLVDRSHVTSYVSEISNKYQGGGRVGGESDEDEESILKIDVKDNQEYPTFYALTPSNGARMLLITKQDYITSNLAKTIPDSNTLIQSAMLLFEEKYKRKAEVAGVAGGSICLFGEYLELHNGRTIYMNLPMTTVVVGSKNDSIRFSMFTSCPDVEDPYFDRPIPSVKTLTPGPSEWVNLVSGVVQYFHGHVSGFDAVVESCLPTKMNFNSCSALQTSTYSFLEGLSMKTSEPLDKINRLVMGDSFTTEQTCSPNKFASSVTADEGDLVYAKHQEHSTHLFDDPDFVFLIASVSNFTTHMNQCEVMKRTKICQKVAEILNKNWLSEANEKHIRCLIQKEVSEEMYTWASYIIKENARVKKVVSAMLDEDYTKFGLLMTESHNSLRNDYGVCSPQLDKLVQLALEIDGVEGAKMLGKGLNCSVVILISLNAVDNCIQYMQDRFDSVIDFYVTKPCRGTWVVTGEDIDVSIL